MWGETMNQLRTTSIGLILLILAACGSSESRPAHIPPPGNETVTPAGPASVRGDRAAVGPVGPAGGVFTLANGARLEIPRGALDEEVDFTFGIGAETSAFNNRDNMELMGPILMAMPGLESGGGEFTLSAPVGAIPSGFTEDDLQLAVEIQDEQQRGFSAETTATVWEYLPATLSGNTATATLPIIPGERFQFVVNGSMSKP